MSTRKRKNAGEGYGYMFSGAFKKKSDAAKKEKTRKGSFVKFAMTQQGGRYLVMTPRTNPIKRKKKNPLGISTALDVLDAAQRGKKNPSELLVMAANPHDGHELNLPAGSTITIRVNPEPAMRENFTVRKPFSGGRSLFGPGLIRTPYQKKHAKKIRALMGPSAATVSRLRKSRKKGPASKVFHEVFGRENPICGATIGGEPCTRKPGHRGPHLPQGATMRTRSRLRRGWQPNPSAAALRSSFTGKDAEFVTVYDEPHMPAGDYAQLGELLALYVKPVSGGQVQQIAFPKSARPVLVSDETARQIYFVGGDQDITPAVAIFQGVKRSDGRFILGDARRIDYKQRKEHVPQPEIDEWRHSFGEESGVYPIVLFDPASRRLSLEGGEYRIEDVGIVN